MVPRRELERTTNENEIRSGQVIRFSYGIEGRPVTAHVLQITSIRMRCRVECGSSRGSIEDFDKVLMTDCVELFAASDLQDLLSQTKNATWKVAMKSKSREISEYIPELKDLIGSETEEFKRKWHVMQILGKGAKLLCKKTNERAKRCLSKSQSEEYKRRWKDLTSGGRLSTFLGCHLGVSVLGVSSRHLAKNTPVWISQLIWSTFW